MPASASRVPARLGLHFIYDISQLGTSMLITNLCCDDLTKLKYPPLEELNHRSADEIPILKDINSLLQKSE